MNAKPAKPSRPVLLSGGNPKYAILWMRDEQRNPVAGPDIDSRGYHVQAGYMLRPRTLEVGARFGDA